MARPDDFMSRTMVENLSVGIHPITGQALPPSDSCANEVVQEALKMVLEHCTLESYASHLDREREAKAAAKQARKDQRRAQYPNGGRPWTAKEREQLRVLYFEQRKSIWEISVLLQRSPQGISSCLKKFHR